MAYQIQSFIGTPVEVQEAINDWLRKYQIEVVTVFSTVNLSFNTHYGNNEWMGTYITVVYKEVG